MDTEKIQRKTCAACAEEILAAANKCKHCGTMQPVHREKAGAVAGGLAGGCFGYSLASFLAVFGVIGGLLISALGLPIIGIPFAIGSVLGIPLFGLLFAGVGASMEAKESEPVSPSAHSTAPEPNTMSMTTALLAALLGLVIIVGVLAVVSP